MGGIIYFSSQSGNTHRFVSKLGLPSTQIPVSPKCGECVTREPFVLIVPTYSGDGGKGAVPKQVIRFLNIVENRSNLRGVIAAGNSNFGATFGIAGNIISAKCQVPYLYRSSFWVPRTMSTMSDTDWNDFGHAHTRLCFEGCCRNNAGLPCAERDAEPL